MCNRSVLTARFTPSPLRKGSLSLNSYRWNSSPRMPSALISE